MNRSLILAGNIIKLFFRKKSNIIIYFLLPILTTLASIALYTGSGSGTMDIAVYDGDKSIISKNIVSYLDKTGKFTVKYDSFKKLESLVKNQKVSVGLVIPKGFEASILNGDIKNVSIYSVKGEDTTAFLKNYLKYYIGDLKKLSVAAKGDKLIFDKMYSGFTKEYMKLNIKNVEDTSVSKSTTVTAMGIFIMFLMLGASSTADEIIKDRDRRTYSRILSAPVNSKQYIFGNFLANFLKAMLQIAIIVFFTMYVFKLKTYVPFLKMLFILGAFSIAAIALGMVIVAFSNNTTQSNALTNLIITPTCMIGGCYWDVSLMPDSLQKISYFTPQRWAISAITSAQNGENLNSTLYYILIILLFAAVFFLTAAYKIKKTDIQNS